MKLKDILKEAQDLSDEESHLDTTTLTLFRENKLSIEKRDKVFSHLKKCKKCRDTLILESKANTPLKIKKNIIKEVVALAASILIFFIVPLIDNKEDIEFKGLKLEETQKNFIEKSFDYWEELIKDIW